MKFFECYRRYRKLQGDLWSINQRIEELQLLCGFPKKSELGIKGQANGDSGLISYINQVNKLKEQKALTEQFIYNIRNDLDRFLDELTKDNYWYERVIELRLLSNKRYAWKEIAEKLDYSVSSVRNFYREGLFLLDKMEF